MFEILELNIIYQKCVETELQILEVFCHASS